MLDVEKLTFDESVIIYQGLMALNYGSYSIEERNEIIRLKSEIRESFVKGDIEEVKINADRMRK